MGFLQLCPPSYVSRYSDPKKALDARPDAPLAVRSQMTATMLRGRRTIDGGEEPTLGEFPRHFGRGRGCGGAAEEGGMQRAPKDSATGRDQAKVLGWGVRKKGGRCAKRRGIVDFDGEEVPTDQLLWARKGGRGEVDESKVGLRRLSVRSLGRWTVRAEGGEVEARGPGAGVSSAKRAGSKPRSCAAVSSLAAAPTRKAHSAQSGLEQ